MLNVGENSARKFFEFLQMPAGDSYENGSRHWFRLFEKDGKHHEAPVYHKARDYLLAHLEKAGFGATQGKLR